MTLSLPVVQAPVLNQANDYGGFNYRVIVYSPEELMVVSKHAGTDGQPAVAYGDSYAAMEAAKRLLESK